MERDKIREKLRQGEMRDQILAEYAIEHGASPIDVLVVPPNRGPWMLIWAAPTIAITLGALTVFLLMRRWRTTGDLAVTREVPARGLDRDPYDARLDSELEELDR
jgi:cytochrome c-type biogenesis protein CcmH/NrfF